MNSSTPATAPRISSHRELIIRCELYGLCIRSAIGFTIVVFLLAARPPQAGEGRPRRSRAMKFTLSWLKEHLDTDASLGEIVDKLTMIGLEVERVEDKAALLEAVRRSPRSSRPRSIPTPTGCASAWSTPATASRSRSCAARPMRAPA